MEKKGHASGDTRLGIRDTSTNDIIINSLKVVTSPGNVLKNVLAKVRANKPLIFEEFFCCLENYFRFLDVDERKPQESIPDYIKSRLIKLNCQLVKSLGGNPIFQNSQVCASFAPEKSKVEKILLFLSDEVQYKINRRKLQQELQVHNELDRGDEIRDIDINNESTIKTVDKGTEQLVENSAAARTSVKIKRKVEEYSLSSDLCQNINDKKRAKLISPSNHAQSPRFHGG